MIFASKTPRDLNHDPKPWIDEFDGRGREIRQSWPDPWTDYAPRAEFDHVQHNRPNPLLADYRLDIAHTGWRDRDPREWLKEVTTRYPGITIPWSPAEIDHALRVLTRLAKAAR